MLTVLGLAAFILTASVARKPQGEPRRADHRRTMSPAFPLAPERASSVAGEVDALFLFILGVTGIAAIGIWIALVYFAIRYRRRSDDERPGVIHGSLLLELTWTVIPFLLMSAMFVWGAKVFFHLNRPPDDAMTVSVVGKRWMWKLQHPTGQREVNELHVPVGRAVKLVITSEDTIHSFYVPAFRIKKDAVPGRYNLAWFRATKTGSYHLFCAEYCGTEHSRMIGRVVVHGARGVPGLALRRADARVAGAARREALHRPQLHHLPPHGRRRPRPRAARHLRPQRHARER